MSQDMKFEIISSYINIPEKNGYSLQLNRIKWENNPPKYDMRRWKDGRPLKGFSLSDSTMKELCKKMAVLAAQSGIADQELIEIFLSKDQSNGSKAFDYDDRQMFTEIHSAYDCISISDFELYISDEKSFDYLEKAGYTTVGDMKGIMISSLELIVGSNATKQFIEMENKLQLFPEDIVRDLWESKKNTKEGRIVDKRVNGHSLNAIAEEEKISFEDVKRLSSNFFYGQNIFLLILKEQLDSSNRRDEFFVELFPDLMHRRYYNLWERYYSPRVIEGNSNKDYPDDYQVNITDFFSDI